MTAALVSGGGAELLEAAGGTLALGCGCALALLL